MSREDATNLYSVGESDDNEPLPDGGNPALEDRSAMEHAKQVNDPFLPPSEVVKNEENVTNVRASFKGKHADVSRQIVTVKRETNNEVFQGADEAKSKMERIKQDAKELEEIAAREAKALGIEEIKPGAPTKAKEANANVNPWDVEAYAEMNGVDKKPAPKINFSGAGSGGKHPKSSLIPHGSIHAAHAQHQAGGHRDAEYGAPPPPPMLGAAQQVSKIRMAKYAMTELREKAKQRASVIQKRKTRLPALHSERMLGESGDVDTTKKTDVTNAKINQAKISVSKNEPGSAPTLAAIKLEEEELIRQTRGKPAAQVVDVLDNFMRKAHEIRKEERTAFVMHKEGQAKATAREEAITKAKMGSANANPANRDPMPADQLAGLEAQEEHLAVAGKAKHDAKNKARQAAADKKAKAAASLAGAQASAHALQGQVEQKSQKPQDDEALESQKPQQVLRESQGPTANLKQDDNKQKEDDNKSDAYNSDAASVKDDIQKHDDKKQKRDDKKQKEDARKTAVSSSDAGKKDDSKKHDHSKQRKDIVKQGTTSSTAPAKDDSQQKQDDSKQDDSSSDAAPVKDVSQQNQDASKQDAKDDSLKQDGSPQQDSSQQQKQDANSQKQDDKKQEKEHSRSETSHEAKDNTKQKQDGPGSSMSSIEEQRPSASEVAKAMAEFGPGGTHCKDCA